MALHMPVVGAALAVIAAKTTYDRNRRLANMGIDEDVLRSIFSHHGVDGDKIDYLAPLLIRHQKNAGYTKDRYLKVIASRLKYREVEDAVIAEIIADIESREPIKLTPTSFVVDAGKNGLKKVKNVLNKDV